MCALSNDVRVSPPEDAKPSQAAEGDGAGVLGNLPRTRPQRATARRAAARRNAGSGTSSNGAGPAETPAAPRRTAAAKGAAKAGAGKPKAGAAGASKSRTLKREAAKPAPAGAARKRRAKSGVAASKKTIAAAAARPRKAPPKRSAESEPVPRQGFASEGDRVSGPVAPPGGAEFLATAAEIVNEVARAGLSSGERLLRDVLSRLPLS